MRDEDGRRKAEPIGKNRVPGVSKSRMGRSWFRFLFSTFRLHPSSFIPHPSKRGRYVNPHEKRTRRNLFHVLLWKMGYYNDKHPPKKIPQGFSYPNPEQPVRLDEPTVTWINHSTFLITINGISLLTDPIWNKRCSPVNFAGPMRQHSAPLALVDLPHIDYVLISHNHYDHLDKKTVLQLHKLYPEIVWFIPLGLSHWFRRLGITNLVELDWWQSFQVLHSTARGLNIQVSAVPAQHFSGRTGYDMNKTLWLGWVVRIQRDHLPAKQFYFVGDTGYNPFDFKEIGERLGSMDLSVIPIGAYAPRRFMSPVHVNPEEAVKIHCEAHSKLSVAAHWGTFKLSTESKGQPQYDLFCAMQEKGLPIDTFRVLTPGQTINW